MARNEHQEISAGDPLLITINDVASITVQNQSADEQLRLWGAIGETPPDPTKDFVILPPGQMFLDVALSELFPGVAANRVYAASERRNVKAFISHA